MLEILIATATGVLVGLAPSLYQRWASVPRIRGSITNVVVGRAHSPVTDRCGITIHAFLSNERDTPVSIVDYELAVKVKGEDWQTLEPVYAIGENLRLGFDEGTIEVSLAESGLRAKATHQLTPSTPLNGFLLFLGPAELYGAMVSKYRLRMFDGYGRRHELTTDGRAVRPPGVLRTLVPPLKVTGTSPPPLGAETDQGGEGQPSDGTT